MANWWQCLICGGRCLTEERLHLHITGPSSLSTPPSGGHSVREELWRDYAHETDLEINTAFQTRGDPE